MNDLNVNNLLDDYSNWIRSQFIVNEKKDYAEIHTPFLNSINDNIRLFVEQTGTNEIELDDDGDTLNNLEMMGVNLNSPQRKLEFESIMRQFNISHPDDRLLVKGNVSEFPIMKQRLITAIIRIDALSTLKKENVARMFYDDVYKYFDDNDFGGLPNYPMTGITGNEYKFNYVMPRLKQLKRPQRLITFQNKLSFNDVVLSLYRFKDVMDLADNNIETIIVYNDRNSKVNDHIQNAIKNSSTKIINFKNKDNLNQLKLASTI